MKIILMLFFLILRLSCSWKEDFFIKKGRYHICYKYQVFITAETFDKSPAFLYCKDKQKDHNYFYPGDTNLHLTGYSVTGYEKGSTANFSNFINSFERYCYLPCDGLILFYNQHIFLKQTLFYIPFLNVLIPYWMKGDPVTMVALDTLKKNLKKDTISSINCFPDITINVTYSLNDSFVREEDALVLAYQLKHTKEFVNVNLLRIDKNQNSFIKTVDLKDTELQKTVKTYEKRQWWLKNLWACKLGLILALLPMLGIFVTRFKSKPALSFAALIIEQIVLS